MAPIHDAVRAGDVEAVRRELAAGVSPDLEEPHFVGAMMYDTAHDRGTDEANEGALEITLLLIEAGADVDSVRYVDWLYSAHGCMSAQGNEAIIAALIAAGASVAPRGRRTYGAVFPLERVNTGILAQLHPDALAGWLPAPAFGSPTKLCMGPRVCCFNAAATDYVNAVAAAGGYVPYETRAPQAARRDIFTKSSRSSRKRSC